MEKQEIEFQLAQREPKTKPTLKEALKQKLPSDLHQLIPRSYDIIGNIAIIELNREELSPLHPYKEIIGRSILEINPHIQTVLEKSGDVDGVFRTRKLSYIAGQKRRDTLYKENGCRFHLNIEEVFFTPRLGYERDRLANMETVFNQIGTCWDIFCGVGPFFIQIAHLHPHMKFLATDINPNAIKYAQENIGLNALNNDITCISMDVSNAPQIKCMYPHFNQISRVIMNLPEKNLEFLNILSPFLHPKGALLHIYQFNEKPEPLMHAKEKFNTALNDLPLEIDKIINARIVKPFSPALETTVLDVIIKRT